MLTLQNDISGDSPDAEGVVVASQQIVDAFNASHIDELVAALRERLGVDIGDLAIVPKQEQSFRGGPYHPGGTHRNVWRIKWERLVGISSSGIDAHDLPNRQGVEAEIVLQWSEYLPFALLEVQSPIRRDWIVQNAIEGLLDKLPGRLGPTNVFPRTT